MRPASAASISSSSSSLPDYAVKVLDKRFIKREGKSPFVLMERNVSARAAHPCLTRLLYTFQDADSLYMVQELCRGGELLAVIRAFAAEAAAGGVGAGASAAAPSAAPAPSPSAPASAGDRAMPPEVCRFYAAQLVCALEYLHGTLGVVHRDLKPENVLLTEKGNLKLTDFGSAKDEGGGQVPTAGAGGGGGGDAAAAAAAAAAVAEAFVGTAEYVSPEVLRDEAAHAPADLWALGCTLYQCLVGRPPFRGASEYLTFQQVLGYDKEATEAAAAAADAAAAAAAAASSSGSAAPPSSSLPPSPLADPLSFYGAGIIVLDSYGDEADLSDFYAGGEASGPASPIAAAALPGARKRSSARPSFSRSREMSAGAESAGSVHSGKEPRVERAASISAALASRPPRVLLRFPAWMKAETRSLLLALLDPYPERRIGVLTLHADDAAPTGIVAGAGGGKGGGPARCGPVLLDYAAVRSHPFFAGVGWETVADARANSPPYVPPVRVLPEPVASAPHALADMDGLSDWGAGAGGGFAGATAIPILVSTPRLAGAAVALPSAALTASSSSSSLSALPPLPPVRMKSAPLAGGGIPVAPTPARPGLPSSSSSIASTATPTPALRVYRTNSDVADLPFGAGAGVVGGGGLFGPLRPPSPVAVSDLSYGGGPGMYGAGGGGGSRPGSGASTPGRTSPAFGGGLLRTDFVAGGAAGPGAVGSGATGVGGGAGNMLPPPPATPSGAGGRSLGSMFLSLFTAGSLPPATPAGGGGTSRRGSASGLTPWLGGAASSADGGDGGASSDGPLSLGPSALFGAAASAAPAGAGGGGTRSGAATPGGPASRGDRSAANSPLPTARLLLDAGDGDGDDDGVGEKDRDGNGDGGDGAWGAESSPGASDAVKADRTDEAGADGDASGPPAPRRDLLGFLREDHVPRPTANAETGGPFEGPATDGTTTTGAENNGAATAPPAVLDGAVGGAAATDPVAGTDGVGPIVAPIAASSSSSSSSSSALAIAAPPSQQAPAVSSSLPSTLFWSRFLDSARGEYAVRWGPVVRRKTFGGLLVRDKQRELVLVTGGPLGPRLLYCHTPTASLRAVIVLADSELRVVLRIEAGGLGGGPGTPGGAGPSPLGSPTSSSDASGVPATPSSFARFTQWLGFGGARNEALLAARVGGGGGSGGAGGAGGEGGDGGRGRGQSGAMGVDERPRALSRAHSKSILLAHALAAGGVSSSATGAVGGDGADGVDWSGLGRSRSFDWGGGGGGGGGGGTGAAPGTPNPALPSSQHRTPRLSIADVAFAAAQATVQPQRSPRLSRAGGGDRLFSPPSKTSSGTGFSLGSPGGAAAAAAAASAAAESALSASLPSTGGLFGSLSDAAAVDANVAGGAAAAAGDATAATGPAPGGTETLLEAANVSLAEYAAQTGRRHSAPEHILVSTLPADLTPRTPAPAAEGGGAGGDAEGDETTAASPQLQEDPAPSGFSQATPAAAAAAVSEPSAAAAVGPQTPPPAASSLATPVPAPHAAPAVAVAAPAAAAAASSAPSAARDRGIFDIHTGAKSSSQGRVYYLYDPLGAAAAWREAILSAKAEALALATAGPAAGAGGGGEAAASLTTAT
jgi:serine/threonine protein kinase